MLPAQTAQAAIDLNAEATVPIHWGAFALSTHSWNDSVVKGSEFFTNNNTTEIYILLYKKHIFVNIVRFLLG